MSAPSGLARLTPRVVIGFVGTWVLALMAANLVPVLISAMVEHLGFTVPQAGMVATAMSIASVLAMLLTARIIARVDRPTAARIGLAIMLVGYGTGGVFLTAPFVVGGLIIGGFGAGAVIASGTAAASSTVNPDRTTFVVMAINRMGAAALLAVAPLFRNDLRTLMFVIAALGLLGLLLAGGLPNLRERSKTGTVAVVERVRESPYFVVGIVLAATMGLWSLTEDMVYTMTGFLSAAAGVDPRLGGTLLALKVVGGLFGALLAPLALRTIGRAWSLAIIVVLSTTTKVLMIVGGTPEIYAVSIVVWGVMYGAALTLVIGLAARLDVGGRIGVLVSTVYLLGVSMGPLVGGALITQVSPAVYAAFVAVPSVAFGIVLIVISRRNRALDRPRANEAATAPHVEEPSKA